MNACLYSLYFFLVSDVQIAPFICSILLLSVACLALPYFLTSHKRHNFIQKLIKHKMFVSISSKTFV